MEKLFRRLDRLAGIETEKTFAKWLERIAFVFLTLMILSAPHSIAATQTAWLAGMFFWAIRIFLRPRLKFVKNPLNLALLAFVGWTIISCVFSYAPDISLDRLRNVSVFLIFFFLVNNLRTRRAVIFVAFALIFSCMVNVVWTPVERIIGRGVEIIGIKPESPLAKVGLQNGDALLKVNDQKIVSPEQLETEIERRETADIYFYRPDFYFTVKVHRADLLSGSNALEKLGFENWKRSRNWRSQGFFAHWATYSEVLQLIAALTFGLLTATFLAGNHKSEASSQQTNEPQIANHKFSILNSQFSINYFRIIFAVCLAGMLFALLLTTTRASQFAFIVAAFAIVWLTGKRKWLLALAVIILPLAVIGFIYLQQARNVGVIDSGDGSTQYRMMMYRDGVRLWTTSVRNFLLGVGMDSIKRYWQDWGLFDKGWQPMGHFHSTILQLLVERGLFALLLWLLVLWRYGRFLVKTVKLKMQNTDGDSDWKTRGILLGCFGALAGFFTSSLVHNNLGDTQVASVFYILMGIGVSLALRQKSR